MTSHTANIRVHAAFLAAAALLSLQACSRPAAATPAETATAPAEYIAAASNIEAGRYLVKIGGCNDCHTPGYVEGIAMTGKAMPEADWLMGGDVGFSGPWGVSYPANLRLSVQNMTEEQFLELARAGRGRPPMPWPSLQAMSDRDLKAIYAYIRFARAQRPPCARRAVARRCPDRPHIPFVPQMPAKS